ncbi:MAG: DUF2764 family protein [Candidatus Omnitrophica bacterium]|nr:DUF2764 family protein [Candidatus Omnitrophota bacterium]
MSQYYIYLISSLPMLKLGMDPPLGYDGFLKLCQNKISDEDLSMLKKISIDGEYPYQDISQATLQGWRIFDTALRNELVRIRAQRLQRDPQEYLRQDGYTDLSIARMANNAHRIPSILEAERMLDGERWRKLDELCLGHYFDIDFLLIYAFKLLILERWQRIRSADSRKMLEQALA